MCSYVMTAITDLQNNTNDQPPNDQLDTDNADFVMVDQNKACLNIFLVSMLPPCDLTTAHLH